MTTTGPKHVVNSPLPQEILPGPNLNPKDYDEYIKSVLVKDLPASDSRNLKSDLQWKLVLAKHSLRKKSSKGKKQKVFLTRRQRLKLNLLRLPKEGWNYASLEPMRRMWKEYMRENLDLAKAPSCAEPDWAPFSTIVAKSELVGADITVVRSTVPNQVGISGTVVLETKMTLQIVTARNQLKILLKPSFVFQFQLDSMRFTVYGKHLAIRPSERSTRKLRAQMVPDL